MKKILGYLFMTAFLQTVPAKALQLMSLNIWGGSLDKPLVEFIDIHQQVDIFCLQEVYHNAKNRISTDDTPVTLDIFSQIGDSLPHHKALFLPIVDNIYGIGIFVRQDIEVLDHGQVMIHENANYIGRGPTHSRFLQWVKCQKEGKIFYVLNVHGLWNGKGKLDSPERIVQSKRIKDFANSLDAPVVLCGDFNLKPETQSMQILDEGMSNLISLHNITSTRTSFYPKSERYADYILTSPGIEVTSFKVLDDEVSDHSPLLLDFEVNNQNEAKALRKSA